MPTAAAPTAAQLDAFFRSPAYRAARDRVAAARVKAQTIRQHVDSYEIPLLASLPPLYVDKRAEGEERERITHPSRLFLSDDEEGCARFYAACTEAHKAHGYNVPDGYCPALMAEHERGNAESALIRALDAACGSDFVGWTWRPEDRVKLVTMLMECPTPTPRRGR